MCEDAVQRVRGSLVFRTGQVVGWYSGQRVPMDREGDYVMEVPSLNLAVDGERSGTIMRFINGSRIASVANIRFGSKDVHVCGGGRVMIPIYAVRSIYAHDELLAYYGADFRFEVEEDG